MPIPVTAVDLAIYLVGVDQNDDNLDDCIGLHGRKFNTSPKVNVFHLLLHSLVNVYAVLN